LYGRRGDAIREICQCRPSGRSIHATKIDPRAMGGAKIEQKENPGLAGLKSKAKIAVRSLFPVSQRITVRE